MFSRISGLFLIILCSASSDNQDYKRCGWFYGNWCPNENSNTLQYPQPWCIDKNLCMAPPFNPVCGKALPLCSPSHEPTNAVGSASSVVEKSLPTLPPINDPRPTKEEDEPDRGYRVDSPLFENPPEDEIEPAAAMISRKPPKIVSAPVSSIVLKEKEPLKLTCSVDFESNPSTQITWIRKRDHEVVGMGETLLLNNVNQSDAGEYICKAQNGNSIAAMVHTEVSVQCPPRVSSGVNHTVITAKPGENVSLICETDCTPEPHFTWYRDTQDKIPLKTCEPVARSSSLNNTTRRTYFCDITLSANPGGDKLVCVKTNSLGMEQQTFEIKSQVIQHSSAPQNSYLSYEAVGCFNRCCRTPNLPKLLFIDSGQTDRYGDSIKDYVSQLVRRCAIGAQSNGFSYFGITSYDECYSGDQTVKTYDSSGPSDKCITGQFKLCSSHDKICIGQCSSMFVYKLKESNTGVVAQRRTFYRKSFKSRRKCSKLKQYLEKIIVLGRAL